MRYGDGLAVVRQQVPFVTQSEQNFDKYVCCFPAVSNQQASCVFRLVAAAEGQFSDKN